MMDQEQEARIEQLFAQAALDRKKAKWYEVVLFTAAIAGAAAWGKYFL